MSENSLPDRWKWATLSEVSEVNPRDASIRDLPDDFSVSFIPMACIDAQKGEISNHEERFLGKVKRGFTQFVDGDVLFAKITPCMENGKAAIASKLINGRGFGSTEFHVLRPSEQISSEWLFYFVRQNSFRNDAKAHFTGTAGQLRVPTSFINNYRIPVPPLNEQRHIITKIEELFTQLDAGTAALKRVQARLKRYKASVLKAAVEGRLVPQDPSYEEETKGDTHQIISSPNDQPYSHLPSGWQIVTIEQVSKQIVDCLHSTPKFVQNGRFCIDTTCITPGLIKFDKARYVDETTYEERIRRLKPEAGDILFSREGTIGTACIVPEDVDLCLGQRMMMFRPTKEVDSSYFLYALLSDFFVNQWKPKVIGTTAPHLNIGEIRQMVIPIPSMEEQKSIVAEVERRLSVTAEIESTVKAELERSTRLRQAILKRAFEGKLVENHIEEIPA